MSYSAIAHALISYMESHLKTFDINEMSKSFGFSKTYLRELFLKNVNIPIMQYYKKEVIIASAFELLHSDKKIIDIALEYGFSNHESYTRAFQKYFNMSPRQFRINRPIIGGKQICIGIFGLECLVSKEKRSDHFMIKQNEKGTILYNIRKIEWGTYGSNTMFPICVKAVSEYLGDDVSYAYIMAATGAAFRLIWNQKSWDLSNIDIYHTLRESNDIYQYGAKALGRDFSFLGREEKTSKEEFMTYIKSSIAKGYPVIALGIVGPPEPCIIAGFKLDGNVVMGWNFFQNDPEFSSTINILDNGYFQCDTWWENLDTQAVMCIGDINNTLYNDKDIIGMAKDIMEPREEGTYAKGMIAYRAWKNMLLEEAWFKNGDTFDNLFSKLLVQNDAMTCICDGRKWAAKYFEELAIKYQSSEKALSLDISKHFTKVSNIAEEMMSLIGNWNDVEKMQENFKNRSIREKLSICIDNAESEDSKAYEKIKLLYNQI